MFSKIEVNGDGAAPLYQWLKSEAPGDDAEISWNFAKFLVDPDGKVIRRWSPQTTPEAIGEELASIRG
jgi:glutathione peroxidase